MMIGQISSKNIRVQYYQLNSKKNNENEFKNKQEWNKQTNKQKTIQYQKQKKVFLHVTYEKEWKEKKRQEKKLFSSIACRFSSNGWARLWWNVLQP